MRSNYKNMESQQNPVDKYNIKSESVDKASNNELVQDTNVKGTNDFDEVSPSATDENTNELWSALKCVFCKKAAIRFEEVKLLECLHSACVSCIDSRLNDDDCNTRNGVLCKICDIPSRNLIENHFLIECTLPSAETNSQVNGDNSRLANVKCTSCHDNLIASSWCVDCNDFLCDGCVQAHQRLKITKDHTIKSKEEADVDHNSHAAVDSKLTTASCPVHPQERLSLFCESCDKLTCRDCQLTEHRAHKYKFIYEIALETRRTISNLLSEVTYKRELLKNAMNVIDDRQKMISDKRKDLLRDITDMVVRLTEAVTKRGKFLVSKLNEICDGKTKTLHEKRVALEQLSTLTDHCIDFITNALARGSDTAVLKTKSAMLCHLQNVKSRRADIPNPEIPVRIQLALDKAQEICQLVNRLGVIIVDGRQYVPPVSPSFSSVPQMQGQSLPAAPAYSMNQPHMNVSNHSFAPPPPSYSSNNNTMASGLVRPPTMSGQNIRQPVPGMNALRNAHSYNVNNIMRPMMVNNQMKTMTLSGYQQQVTSSTHPQNSLFNSVMPNSSYDQQGLRKLLLTTDKTTTLPHTTAHPHNIRSGNATMSPGLYQTVDTNTKVQSPSPQGFSSHKMQYSPTIPQIYQQSYQTGQMMQPKIQNQPGRSTMASPNGRQIYSRENSLSPLTQQLQHQQQLQWHRPQINTAKNVTHTSINNEVMMRGVSDDSYKITLPSTRKPSVTPPSTGVSVTSSVSKTPSPLNQGKSSPEETEKNLDKVGQDSVNDLMATIARLDSNGIEVIPETTRKTNDSHSPLVDSSTGPPIELLSHDRPTVSNLNNSVTVVTEPQKGNDDPNEDWCAVCMDGGQLVCCDNCPKVFHINCHIPPLVMLPSEHDSWQCMLCTNIMENVAVMTSGNDEKPEKGLSKNERKVVERMLLELYCQYEPSLAFREIVSPTVTDYHEKIKKPISLDIIQRRLSQSSAIPYNDVKEVIKDVRLIFKNAYLYNEESSAVYNDAKTLEEFFDQMLEKWLPMYAYDDSLRLNNGETRQSTTVVSLVDENEENDLDGPPSKRCKKMNGNE